MRNNNIYIISQPLIPGQALNLMIIRDYIDAVVDLVYPRHCYSCDNTTDSRAEQYICGQCRTSIKTCAANRCSRCGLPIGPYITAPDTGCISCRDVKLWFDSVHCVTEYSGVIRALVHQYKYNRKEALAIPLSNFITESLDVSKLFGAADLVVPVPLFWKKRIRRQFNQSETLAKRLAKHYSVPISATNLRRIRNTSTQVNLSRIQRSVNVEGAFEVRSPERLLGKSILLVDDVMTTGATASECARTLKDNGARSVSVVTLARTTMT